MSTVTTTRFLRPRVIAFFATLLVLMSFSTTRANAQGFVALPTSQNITATIGVSFSIAEKITWSSADSILLHGSVIGPDASHFDVPYTPIWMIRDTFRTGEGAIFVNFLATVAGTYHASFVISDHLGTSDTIPITATATDITYPIEMDTEIDLVAYLGDTACFTMPFANLNSGKEIVITGYSTAVGNPKFTIEFPTPDTLAPLQRGSFRVCYKPTTVTGDNDNLTLNYYIEGRLHHITIILHGKGEINSNTCVHIIGDSSALALGIGQVTTRIFSLKNDQAWPVTVTMASVTGATTHFSVSGPTFPLTLASGASADFDLKYQAGNEFGYNTYRAQITFPVEDSGGGKCTNVLDISGTEYGSRNVIDTSSIDLFPATTQKVDINLPRFEPGFDLIRVTNNTTSRAKIDTAYMLIGTYFAATLIAPADSIFPFYVPSSSSFVIGVELLDSSHTNYDDTLIIISEHAILPTRYPVHATLHTQAVRPGVQVVTAVLSVYPNPSTGMVNVNLGALRNAKVEVLDILGRVVAEARPSGSNWVWSGTTSQGAAPNGSYILRATGLDSQNARVTLSSRLTLTR